MDISAKQIPKNRIFNTIIEIIFFMILINKFLHFSIRQELSPVYFCFYLSVLCRSSLAHWSVARIDEKAVVLAFANMCAMFHTVSMVGVTLPANPSFRSQKSIGFSMLNGMATCASALPIANSLWLGLLWGPHYKTKKRWTALDYRFKKYLL